jgi:hypothetical protein
MPAQSAEKTYSGKLRPAEYLTAISALVLFLTTFKPWFELPSIDQLKKLAPDALIEGSGAAGTINLNVWDLHFGRWFVYLAILLAAWMVLAAVFSANPEWAVILATPTVVVSGIAMLALIYRVFSEPRASASATTIFYVAVAASIGLFAGACWSIRDETVPPGFAKAPPPEVIEVDHGHLDSAP